MYASGKRQMRSRSVRPGHSGSSATLGSAAGRETSAKPPKTPPRSRRVFELGAERADQFGGCTLTAGVGRGQDPDGVGPAEGTNHGARVVDVPARDQVLEQWQAGVVEWYVR